MSVALGSCWRRGGASPVWSAHEALPDGRMMMTRWVARHGELVLATMHAPVVEFTGGQWKQVSVEEMTRETKAQEEVARTQRNPPTAPEGVNAALDAEAERLRVALADGPAGGVRGTIDQLREVHELIAREGPVTIQVVSRAVTHAAPILGRLLELTERAAEHLDELHGPAVVGWRCDHCEWFVPEELAPRWDDDRQVRSRIFHVRAVFKGDPIRELEYLECLHGGEHGPMRHVLCRVTADSPPPPEPEPATVAPVATPDGGGGS